VAAAPAAAPASAPKAAPSDVPDYARQIERIVERKNMAGIVCTILSLSGRPADADSLRRRIEEYARELRALQEKLAAAGTPCATPEHFEPRDRFVTFREHDSRVIGQVRFAEALKEWLRGFRAGAHTSAALDRSGAIVVIEMKFPERPKEFLALANLAEVDLGSAGGPAAAEAPVPPPVPAGGPETSLAELVADVNARLTALHPGYQKLIPAQDLERTRRLISTGRGTSADAEFLRRLATDLLAPFAEEYAAFAAKLTAIEEKVLKSVLVDIVSCRDGRRLEGRVDEEGAESVKVTLPHGSVRIPRADILRIERGRGSGAEVARSYSQAAGDFNALVTFYRWCASRDLAAAREMAAYAILVVDPSYEPARAETRLGGTAPAPAAANEGEVRRDKEEIVWNGNRYTPEQLTARLKSLGFLQLNGIWCEKVARSYSLDNLYRDEGKLRVTHRGTSLWTQALIVDGLTYDYRARNWVSNPKLVPIARFFGSYASSYPSYYSRASYPGSPSSTSSYEYSEGGCYIEIEAPGDIVECRVKAVSQVAREGGQVTVAVLTSPVDREPKTLYTLSTPGRSDGQHDVTEKVRGYPVFYVRGQPTRNGMFLPGDDKDLNVLDVRYKYGKPLDRLNAALGLTRLPLK
jgi:hypothetical protein